MSKSSTSQPITFTTGSLPPASRLDAWNAAFGSLNAISLPGRSSLAHVHCTNWSLGGGIILSETQVSNSTFSRHSLLARRDHLDHWVLRVLLRGRSHMRHPRFEETAQPGDLVLFSMQDTWTVDWEDADWVSLCIPRDLDIRMSAGLDEVHPGRLQGARAGLFADLLRALPARAAMAQESELPALATVVHGAVKSLLLSPQRAEPTLAPEVRGAARERVRRAILQRIDVAELRPAQLAVAAGLSRSALYRIFEADGGVARYIQQVRLSLANAALRDPLQAHVSISAIAEAHGFPDPSAFSRAFRKAFGATPRDVRGMPPERPEPVVTPRIHLPRPLDRDIATRIYAPE